MIGKLLRMDSQRRRALATAYVVAEPVRCVECGMCNFNCPLGIDVRSHARLGQPIADSYCLTCGECVARCPRGTLRLESSRVFDPAPMEGKG